MPAGVVQLAMPTAVMPLSLSSAFIEIQTLPARVNEYHDGTSHRSPILAAVRRSWRLAKHLPNDQLLELRAFWETQGLASFYFYNPSETSPRYSYDPTGSAVQGRYTVRFNNSWSQQTGIGMVDTEIELIEVLRG
jgi:hypothetical protein